MNRYICGAHVDIGCDRENQEDFVQYKELDEQNLLCIIADGTGSRKEHPQPAAIAAIDIAEHIQRLFSENKDLFMNDPEYFMKDAFLCANRILGAFKLGNEELYSGYAASVTAAVFTEYGKVYFAHCGNTRAYIIRNGKIIQITKDHTRAAKLYEDGNISFEAYHVHPDRLTMTSGIGVVTDPEIQTEAENIRQKDLVLLTTDGVHYAIQPEYLTAIILESEGCQNAATNLVMAAKTQIKYPDNMSAMVIHGNPDVRI